MTDPLDQLVGFRIEVDEETRARDLAAVSVELRLRPTIVPRTRRWMLGVVVAVILAGPAAAVASGGAVPGDLLYPIKRATEPFVQLLDPDLVVERRVDEVAVLIDRQSDDAVIEERIAVARDAVAGGETPGQEERLDRIVDRWVGDRSDGDRPVTDVAPPSTQRSEPEPERPSDLETEPAPVEPPTTTTTTDSVRDRPPPSDSATTTSTTIEPAPAPNDGDRPPPDDRPGDRP